MREAPVIRPATIADLEDIQRIYTHAVLTSTVTWDEAPWPMEQRLRWFEEHQKDFPVIVAEAEGNVAGFATLTPMSQMSGWRFTREDSVYVDEAHRRAGVGAALLQTLIDQARAAGIHVLIAAIDGANEPSLHLHRRLGFQDAGVLRETGFKFGRRHDAHYLQLTLPG